MKTKESGPKKEVEFAGVLEREIVGIKDRIAEFKERAQKADRVVITIICCDSRVVLPETLLPIKTTEGTVEQVLFIPIPTIGSGAPSRSRLRGIEQQIVGWGVDEKNISYLVTQHGGSNELHEKSSGVTCGLRKVLGENEQALSELHRELRSWTYRKKAELHDKTFAPDRLSLAELRESAPRIMELVDAIHKASGIAHKASGIARKASGIARRLIIRAAYRNYHSDMGLNENGVMDKIHEHLLAEMTEDSVVHAVGYAAYDHQTKVLHLTNPEANFGRTDSLIPTGLEERTDTHQDPHYCVVSFGNETIPLAVRALFPGLCGLGTPSAKSPEDNAFRTVASIPTVPTLLCGLAEASYAVQHKNNPHKGDKNFRSLRKLIIVCSDDSYTSVVREMLADTEFQKEYLPMLRILQPEGLHVVNLHLNAPRKSAESFVLRYQDAA